MKLYFDFKEKNSTTKEKPKKKKSTFRKQCHISPVDRSIDILISGKSIGVITRLPRNIRLILDQYWGKQKPLEF